VLEYLPIATVAKTPREVADQGRLSTGKEEETSTHPSINLKKRALMEERA
jgi:hypothetical protein